jgi:hypothetical protein
MRSCLCTEVVYSLLLGFSGLPIGIDPMDANSNRQQDMLARLLVQAREMLRERAEAYRRAKRDFPQTSVWVSQTWDAFCAACEYIREIIRSQDREAARAG